ncbi:MAG: hypothetical protein IPO08_20120 [Xanthomonadales bacterium]|nr:hypothetical protein [Xanthomonadales bacterium]
MKRTNIGYACLCFLFIAVMAYWGVVIQASLLWELELEQRVEKAIEEHAKSH